MVRTLRFSRHPDGCCQCAARHGPAELTHCVAPTPGACPRRPASPASPSDRPAAIPPTQVAIALPRALIGKADSEGPAAIEPQNSQGYLAHVAARAVIVLRADNPTIGEVAVVAVGMSDVSTCVLHPDLVPGQHLTKGEELGHFAFGGSTHCLVLRPGAVDSFTLAALPSPADPRPPLNRVRAALAYAANR